jgi:hypothetical protein
MFMFLVVSIMVWWMVNYFEEHLDGYKKNKLLNPKLDEICIMMAWKIGFFYMVWFSNACEKEMTILGWPTIIIGASVCF